MANKDLYEAVKRGDASAFEKVFLTYSQDLYFIAMGLLNDQEVAKDAVQECFIYLWNHREQIDVNLPIENYLRRSVKNYALNYLRHLKVRAIHEDSIVREQAFLNEEDDLSGRIEEIRRVVDTLPENCRKIFVMAVIEGMSYADTAEKLGVSVNTVKSQVRIAYKKIKNNVQENPDNMTFTYLFLLSLEKML